MKLLALALLFSMGLSAYSLDSSLPSPWIDVEPKFSQMEKKEFIDYMLEKNLLSLDDIPDRIVGGVVADTMDAPYQAQLWVYRKFGPFRMKSFICGGSIVSKRTILSAGHCVG